MSAAASCLTPSLEFVEENGRVVLQPARTTPSRGTAAVERLRRARLRTRLSTEELLALTRGEEP